MVTASDRRQFVFRLLVRIYPSIIHLSIYVSISLSISLHPFVCSYRSSQFPTLARLWGDVGGSLHSWVKRVAHGRWVWSRFSVALCHVFSVIRRGSLQLSRLWPSLRVLVLAERVVAGAGAGGSSDGCHLRSRSTPGGLGLFSVYSREETTHSG